MVSRCFIMQMKLTRRLRVLIAFVLLMKTTTMNRPCSCLVMGTRWKKEINMMKRKKIYNLSIKGLTHINCMIKHSTPHLTSPGSLWATHSKCVTVKKMPSQVKIHCRGQD